MFSEEENLILENIYFEELIKFCQFNFTELIIISKLLDGFKSREIWGLLEISERNFFKIKKNIMNRIERKIKKWKL